MTYQTQRDKHRATAREFRVVNATTAHDFVLEVPGEARLFVLLDMTGQANIAATAYRDIQRWARATGICQRICKAHVFNKTFGVNSTLNAEVFVAPPHAVAMEFNLFGERRSGHWVKGGGVIKREGVGIISIADCKLKNACKLKICPIQDAPEERNVYSAVHHQKEKLFRRSRL